MKPPRFGLDQFLVPCKRDYLQSVRKDTARAEVLVSVFNWHLLNSWKERRGEQNGASSKLINHKELMLANIETSTSPNQNWSFTKVDINRPSGHPPQLIYPLIRNSINLRQCISRDRSTYPTYPRCPNHPPLHENWPKPTFTIEWTIEEN